MEALARMMIATVDLVEAEGRSLRRGIVRLGVAAALGVIALLVAGFGVVFVLLGVYRALASVMPEPAAAVVFGALALVGAGGMTWWARSVLRS
jgi:hypothetical protein